MEEPHGSREGRKVHLSFHAILGTHPSQPLHVFPDLEARRNLPVRCFYGGSIVQVQLMISLAFSDRTQSAAPFPVGSQR